MNGAGEVIDATIWVEQPGSGLFTVYPSGLVGRDTALSARVALTLAALFNRLNPSTIDGGVYFRTRGSVSGASAGLAFLAGFYALLHNSAINTSIYSFTGLVTPSGLIAAVGGLPEKIEAAKSRGIREVFVPVEGGLNKSVAGVRVVRVCSFAGVASKLYGVAVSAPPIPRDRLFCNATAQLTSLLRRLLQDYGGRLNASAKIVEARLREAERLARDERCYAAASVAFSTLAFITSIAPKSILPNITELILSEVNRSALAAHLYMVKTELTRLEYVPLWKLEAALAAIYRFYAAVKLLSESKPSLRALGALRLLTASQWLSVADAVKGPLVRAEAVKRALSFLVSYASLSYQYLESLVHGRQVTIENTEHLRLKRLVSDMQMYYVKGDLLTAAALALEALDTINRVMVAFDMHLGAEPSKIAECSLKQALFNERVAGYRSLISTLLTEYAMSVNDTISRALIAADASSYTLLVLAAGMLNSPYPGTREAGCSVSAALLSASIGAVIVAGGALSAVILSKKVE